MSEVDWNALKKRSDDATKPAPPGDHIVEIKKCSWKMNQSNNPMYSIQGTIVDGPAEGKAVFNNFNVTVENDFALSIFFRHMAALGLDENFFGAGPSHDQVCQALVGRRAVFSLEIRQWQDSNRNGVTDVKPIGGPMASMVGVVTPPGMMPGSMNTPSYISSNIPTPNTTNPTTPDISQRPSVPAMPSTTPPLPPSGPFDITSPTA